MKKSTQDSLEKLKDEGFSISEVESVSTFINRDPEIGQMVLQHREELAKNEFLALIGHLNSSRETWQYKLAFVAVFSLVLALVLASVITCVLLWR
jgi:hypothetical protein